MSNPNHKTYGAPGLPLLAVFLMLLLTGNSARALQVPGPLVETDWLDEHRDQVTILDVREDIESFTRQAVLVRKRFTGDLRIRQAGAHIPGAVLVDFLNIRTSRKIDDRSIRYMVPEKEEFSQLMQSWGVNRGAAIVIVAPGMHNRDMTIATRLYWQIKYFGHDNVTILNGGMAQWLLEQLPASIEAPEPAPGDWVAREVRDSIKASSDDVTRALEDDSVQLVDTRGLGLYLGTWKKSYVRKKGHIPGAKVFPDELLTSAEPPVRFSEPEEVAQIARELGIDTGASLITYCNSGQLASGSWFYISELLGNKNARLYDGSMHQWTLEKRPVINMKME
jgi:thiosulfate/3-mercaptopyruvate sulfurtransferase